MEINSKPRQNRMKLPNLIIASAGRFMGMLAYFIDMRHRRIVRRNLAFAFPDWSQKHIRAVSRKVYQYIGITVLEIIEMTFMSRQKIFRKVVVRNGHYMEKALNDKNGVILISAHIGNWEMAHVFASAYFNMPFVLVARELDSKMLDRWINGIRARFGSEICQKKGALNKMARTLRDGKAVGIMIDQETRTDESVTIKFFNHAANATPAAALLARRYDASVLPVFCIRGEDGGLILDVQPPLELVKTQDRQTDIQTNTQIMGDAVEHIIKFYPEQWFWVHKRWKRHHPELYPEDMARHERRKRKKRKKMMKENKVG